jgi:hypothetical protein
MRLFHGGINDENEGIHENHIHDISGGCGFVVLVCISDYFWTVTIGKPYANSQYYC